MTAGSEDAVLALGGGIFVVPVLHERLESAVAVRRALARVAPDAVAVEVPSTLSRVWARAIDRLPSISVLLYENAAGDTIYLPVHPADPSVEASRWARERGLPIACALLYRIGVEEAALVARFGAEYEAYRRTSKRLIPGVY